MDYADYRQSRDMTWRLLLKHDVTALPVRVGAICRAEGLTVISYHDADPLIRQYGLTEHAAENDGFTLGKIIFYDNTRCTPERQRFTIAHELGHIMLHHSGRLKIASPPTVMRRSSRQQTSLLRGYLRRRACFGAAVCIPRSRSQRCAASAFRQHASALPAWRSCMIASRIFDDPRAELFFAVAAGAAGICSFCRLYRGASAQPLIRPASVHKKRPGAHPGRSEDV